MSASAVTGAKLGQHWRELLLRYAPASTCRDAGVSLDHRPPATKFPKCKMGTQKLWHKGVEMFMGELDPAAAANRWDLHEICIFSGCIRDKCLFLKRCHRAKAGTKWSIPTCPASLPLLLAIFPPPFPLRAPEQFVFACRRKLEILQRGYRQRSLRPCPWWHECRHKITQRHQ